MKLVACLFLACAAWAQPQSCESECRPSSLTTRFRWATRLKQEVTGHIMCKEDTQQTLCLLNSSSFLRQAGYSCGPCRVVAACPEVGMSQALPYSGGSELVLSPSSADTLCTLTMVSDNGDVIPVARSYLGYPWEANAGHYSRIKFQCANEGACVTILPRRVTDKLRQRLGSVTLELSSFRRSVSDQESAARFLERTTFGPTLAEIEALSTNTFAQWVSDQQQLPITSHRKLFRENVDGRSIVPSTAGVPTHACDRGTVYRQYAFSSEDHLANIEIRSDGGSRKVLLIDGEPRTVVLASRLQGKAIRNKAAPLIEFDDGVYQQCGKISDRVRGNMRLNHPTGGCRVLYADGRFLGNPRVYFDSQTNPARPAIMLDGAVSSTRQGGGLIGEIMLSQDLRDPLCPTLPSVTQSSTLVGLFENQYWLHDPRFVLQRNTLEDPLPDGGKSLVEETHAGGALRHTLCSNVRRNFLNEETCKITTESACGEATVTGSAAINLNRTSIEMLQDTSGKLVYVVKGLRQDLVPYGPPCEPNSGSRWIRAQRCDPSRVGVSTHTVFQRLLSSSPSRNPVVRDVIFPANGAQCDSADANTFDFHVVVSGDCWKNVHRDLYQVYDFSSFADDHPGGPAPIVSFTERANGHILTFPEWHDTSRWHSYKNRLTNLGRYHDTIDIAKFRDLAVGLVDFGLNVVETNVVCGSDNEVANIRSSASPVFDMATYGSRTTGRGSLIRQRSTVWLRVALNSDDQLRQRVAWALSQILAISPSETKAITETETFVHYYDIFVRNAFTNYRNILKEVAFSPQMGVMLSYVGSQSTSFVWERTGKLEYADENFAREIMQLFSIGLVMLNMDGTVKKERNLEIPTYSNDDITEYARIWTGFQRQLSRGNIDSSTLYAPNTIDPMRINKITHDAFPKMGLLGRYVGDGQPLCRDLPFRHFLKSGAKYRLLGQVATPVVLSEPGNWPSNPNVKRLVLDSASLLASSICGPSEGCDNRSLVELVSDVQCTGIECTTENPRVIEVRPGVYYEYERPPCVYQAFFDGQAVVSRAFASCADPQTNSAGVVCCNNGQRRVGSYPERFTGEELSLVEASSRCNDLDEALCSQPSRISLPKFDNRQVFWTSQSCQTKAKVDAEGRVGIVHSPPENLGGRTLKSVDIDTQTFFRVHWSSDLFTRNFTSACSELGCDLDLTDNTCLCPAQIEEDTVFRVAPRRKEVLSSLHIGAIIPDSFQSTTVATGVKMYSTDGLFSASSIFEVVDDNGVVQLRKNVRSMVVLGSRNTSIRFRNPPHFVSIVDPQLRDIYHEIDEGLSHFFYHPNTAPFLALRFSQRFGISSPSPRFVESMSKAFRKGFYVDTETGLFFGSGEYGDLSALTASMLLDREYISPVLDLDVSSGSLTEPFLKFVHVMRSLQFVPDADHAFAKFGMNMLDAVGQFPHALPSVFSFFLPEYSPAGSISKAGLLCPECQVLTGPKAVALINGLCSLVKYGWDNAYGGFGTTRAGKAQPRAVGRRQFATGTLAYTPSNTNDIATSIDEIALLLAGGRVNERRRAWLQTVASDSLSRGESLQFAIMQVIQAVLVLPEFQSNGLISHKENNDDSGEGMPTEAAPPRTYKSVIQLMLSGGMDSFNVLVPQSCTATNSAGVNIREQYRIQRGDIALSERERRLSIEASPNQPCTTFNIHERLTIVKELYDSGDLVFLANTGVVEEAGMTRENFRSKTKVQLFAHNGMQKETNTVDPKEIIPESGVLGRLATSLTQKGFRSNSISVDLSSVSLQTEHESSGPIPLIVSRSGLNTFDRKPEEESAFNLTALATEANQHHPKNSSMYGQTWSEVFLRGIDEANFLRDALAETTLGSNWPTSSKEEDSFDHRVPPSVLKVAMIARMMQSHSARGSERDIFYTEIGGWDHHYDMKARLDTSLQDLNHALTLLVTELKDQGLWENTTIVITSDFGRTITPNSGGGSDHGWAGHYMMIGGGVKGKQIVGKYPSDISPDGPMNVGRGRLIPDLSWDSIWNGVHQWMGLETAEELDYALPNRHSSTAGGSQPLLTLNDLYNV